jgi:hypothetical protein
MLLRAPEGAGLNRSLIPTARRTGAVSPIFCAGKKLGNDHDNQEGRVLVITRRGPPPRPFGWEIRDAVGEIARSAETFRARYEAIADGQRKLDELQAGSVNH